MSGQQQTVDSSLSRRIQRCFSPKTPYGSHQCGCENWDFSFSSPTFSWLLLWDVPPPYNLGADKKKELEQSGAPFYTTLGKVGLMKWVSILGSWLLRVKASSDRGPTSHRKRLNPWCSDKSQNNKTSCLSDVKWVLKWITRLKERLCTPIALFKWLTTHGAYPSVLNFTHKCCLT